MEIKKLKSSAPTIHDNTESDLILVPPSILDSKLRDFEIYHSAKSTMPSDITLAITFIVAIFATSFIDFPFLKGSTVRGAFIAGFIITFVKIVYSIYRIFWANGNARPQIIKSLIKSSLDSTKKTYPE